jgi:DNA polymerase III alpha subunit
MITELKRRKSKKGQWWALAPDRDLEGLVEVLVFPKAYETSQQYLEGRSRGAVTGRLRWRRSATACSRRRFTC